ncbi:unnamed protein product [Phytophthora lilii]|uniref:RxLR effector protein n=1 Tax=Phytophthora lilii TaxID=2077276 RepID=A0A9W7DCE8_9STRA|nr:unnamed protein product [Phytophthora lilii]
MLRDRRNDGATWSGATQPTSTSLTSVWKIAFNIAAIGGLPSHAIPGCDLSHWIAIAFRSRAWFDKFGNHESHFATCPQTLKPNPPHYCTMRLSSIILVATATLVVSYSTVSAAPGSKISAVASDATPPKNARFLRSFKTKEGDEDDKLESGKEERGGYPFLVPESAAIEMGKRIEDSTSSWEKYRTSPVAKTF